MLDLIMRETTSFSSLLLVFLRRERLAYLTNWSLPSDFISMNMDPTAARQAPTKLRIFSSVRDRQDW